MSDLHYLRVEAVNLDYFVYDTEDLNTVRGGGLLLLDAPKWIEAQLQTPQSGAAEVEVVTSGASQAIFRFRASGVTAEAVRNRLATWLRRHQSLGHATFVVDVHPVGTDFVQDKEALLTLNRWRQMQQSRLAVPVWNDEALGARPYCGVDYVRAGTVEQRVANSEKKWVSASVKARADYGRSAKQQFYRTADPTFDLEMSWDFQQIAARGECRVGERGRIDPLRHLDGKLAVFYADGNQFGKIGRASCTSVERQRAWDKHVQGFRKEFLKNLLAEVRTDDEWKCQLDEETVVRLETLLWGGDEMLLVVPAWKGWSVVQRFYRDVAAWPAWQPPTGDPLRLTHAAGLVFCHAEAPIHRIRDLAKELADQAKQLKDAAPPVDAFSVLVLESFDQLGQSLTKARELHLPAGGAVEDLLIRADELDELTAALRTMIEHFPHGSVYRILRAHREGSTDEATRWLERAAREVGKLPDLLVEQESDAPAEIRRKRARWLHLAELWNYLPVETTANAGVAAQT